MIVGIGIDVLEVRRMEAELAREGGGFRDDVFTPAEIACCTSQSHSALHFATRFAVKEAVLKALGTGVLDGASWREIECGPDDGDPRVRLHGRLAREASVRGARGILVTHAHTPDWALAGAVLVK